MHQSHGSWSEDEFLDSSLDSKWEKVIQILYIRLWYSTIQYELIAYKKLIEAYLMTEINGNSTKHKKHPVIFIQRK